jgi:hypothetical protein
MAVFLHIADIRKEKSIWFDVGRDGMKWGWVSQGELQVTMSSNSEDETFDYR